MSQKQRQIRNYLINPAFQLKYTLYFFVTGMCVIGVLLMVIYQKIESLRFSVANHSEGDVSAVLTMINDLMVDTSLIALYTVMGFALISFVYSVVISHRVAGPVVAIVRYIEEIRSGTADPQRKLRKYDELSPIMDALNKLAASLKK